MKKTLALVLALVLTLALVPFNALAGGATVYAEINYVNGKGESQEPQNCKQLFAEDGNTLAQGWYFVSSHETFNGQLNISGDVNLILCDGYTLNVKGIYISESSKLTIWAQSTGENQGAIVSTPESGPGIGGGNDAMGGDLVINGGKITAKGAEYAAGIGAGDAYAKATGYSSITINGGDITATGGDSGAGIGGGCFSYSNGPITINGGKVVAIGGEFAAGIGGGEDRTSPKIVISGGNVYAKATFEAAGIGGGDEGGGGDITITGGTVEARGSSGAGIGGGKQGRGGTVNISGGTITAEGWQGAGIGGGRFRDGGVINISGGTVTATGTFSAAGIGGGWGGAGGTITISGGDVKAIAKKTYGADEGTGAGIGGGTEAYGGTIQITGGRVEAHTEAPNSHAIGCGEYKENNSQVLTIGDELCVYAGNDGTNWENGTPFSTSLRAEACKYRTNCLIETCEHPGDAHYGNITEQEHQRCCDYCLHPFVPESHVYDASTGTATCTVCGYSRTNCAVTFDPVGASGTMSPLYVVPGGTVTLPDNGFEVPENRVFGGWSRTVTDTINHTYVMKVHPAYSTIENVTENLTLYARWLSTVTIGTRDMEVTYSADGVTVPVGEMFTIPAGTGKATYDVDNGAGRYNAKTGKLTVLECGTFTVMVDIAETDTHVAASAIATLTVKKANPTAEPPKPTATYGQTLSDVTLTNPEGNTDGAWTWAVDASTSVGDAGEQTFTANFTPTDTANYNPVSNVDVKVSVGKAPNPATVSDTATVKKGGNTVDLAGNVTANGATGEVSYAISGEANGCKLNGSVLTSGDAAGTVTVNVTVAADNNHEALDAAPITVTITEKDTQTIAADDVTATYGDTDKSVSASLTNPAEGGGAISYAVKDGFKDYIDVDATSGALTIKKVPADGKACVVVTAAETQTYAQATRDVTVTINKANAVPATVTANSRTYDGTEQPLVTADSSALAGGEMQYALGTKDAVAQAYAKAIPTAAEAKTYYVWYKVAGDENHLDYEAKEPVEVKISNASVAPTAPEENALVYNGEAQALLKKGEVSGGTLFYALGADAVTAPTEGWSEEVPTGKDAGTYHAWYKVEGDANHNGVDPVAVTVTIKAKPLTVTAVAASKTVGEADPALEYTADGLVAGDALTGALEREKGEDVGTYAIRQGTLAAGANYELTYVEKLFTINAAPEQEPQPQPEPEPQPQPEPQPEPQPQPQPQPQPEPVDDRQVLIGTVTSTGNNSLNVTWGQVKGADGYDVFFTNCGNDSFKLAGSVMAGQPLSYSFTGLDANRGYKVVVKAWQGAPGNYVKESPVSHCYTGGGAKNIANPGRLTLKKSALTIKLGKKVSIKASVKGVKKGKVLAHDGKLRYISSDPAVATVSSKGKVKAVGAGSCTICVMTTNGIWKTVTVTVDASPTKIKISRADRIMVVGETQNLGAKVVLKPAKAVTTLSWSSSNPDVASVDANGVVTAKGKGKATITVTAANGKKAKVKIEVKEK